MKELIVNRRKNMKRLHSLALSALLVSMTACQSDTWHIAGVCDNLEDGDTLYITSDLRTGTPMDTAVIKDGKFDFAGDEDTLLFCVVYSPQDNSIGCPVFIEKGNVTMILSKDSDSSKVSGTPTNDKWQSLNEKLSEAGQDIDRVSEIITTHTTENINSEYGCFLLTYFDDGATIKPQTRMELIGKLPAAIQDREIIKRLTTRTEKEISVSEGAVIKDFTMNNINGKETSILQEIKGKKVVIIDFWASWCPPCRAEMPRLVALYAKYAPKGLGIVGISLDNDAAAWKAETQRLGITWTQMSDLQGWSNAAAQMFAVQSIPHIVVVDGEGKILKKGLRGEALEKYIEEYLSK